MAEQRDVVLELIRAYGHLQCELNVTYYNQDSDEIRQLEELVDQLEAEAGIEWVDGAPRWKAASAVAPSGESVISTVPDIRRQPAPMNGSAIRTRPRACEERTGRCSPAAFPQAGRSPTR